METLIILVKNPIITTDRPTALQVFSEEQMLELKTAFVEDTICTCAQLDSVDLKVAVAPADRAQMITQALENLRRRFPRRRAFTTLAKRLEILTQEDGPLNGRTRDAIGYCFERGYKRVLTIGGYNPTITKNLLTGALSELRRHHVVLGPTLRGGCYLIGVDNFKPEIFEDVPVGTDLAYAAFSERLREAGMAWKELDLWYDVSHQEDIEFIVRDINQFRLTNDEESARATEDILTKYLDQTKEETSPKDGP